LKLFKLRLEEEGVLMKQQKSDFLFIVPPIRDVYSPPLGVSLLKANLEKNGVLSSIYYANLNFVRKYGLAFHIYLDQVGPLITEYMYSHWLFQRTDKELEDFQNILELDYPGIFSMFKILIPYMNVKQVLLFLIEIAGKIIDDTIEVIMNKEVKYLGFSSNMSENCFSLSVMNKIKKISPYIRTIIGGANCNGVMGRELFEKFHEIDYVCQGEADHSLVELILQLKTNGKQTKQIEGVYSREFQYNS
jgi:hypothetical protein